MAGKKSLKGKGYYVTYKATNQCEKNRKKDLTRHLKDHPTDKQAAEAVKNPRGHYRATSKTKRWNSESRWFAQIERQMKGLWKAVQNGQILLPPSQPEFANYGDKIELSIKEQSPDKKKKSGRKNGKKPN